jgi:NodT family efflux transporter outer membrane factor (OMF) lipoprotein
MIYTCFICTLALFFLGLSSCGVQFASDGKQVTLPANWKNAAGFPVASPSQDLTRWWKRFDDTTLTDIIAEALVNNPDMASSSARILEATSRRNAEAATLFPYVQGSSSVNSSGTNNDNSGSDSSSKYSAGITASWEADLFGKRRNIVAAASARVGATEENFHSVQAALASEIGIAYTQLRVNEAALSVLQRTIKTREETSRLASWRTESGETDLLESSQALSSLEQARAAVPVVLQEIGQSRNLLALLTGQVPGSLDIKLASGKKTIPNPASSLAVGIPADTIRQRPDVRLAGYELLAAASDLRAADAERYPSLNLTGSLGLNTLSSGRLFNPENATTGIIVGLTGPIFDAGRIRSTINAQGAREEQAFQTYRSRVLTALSEVENSLIVCRRTSERLATLEKATAAASQAAKLAQQRYEAGAIDILTVLDSQRTLLNLEDSLFTVRANRTIAYIQLYKALGGGWS